MKSFVICFTFALLGALAVSVSYQAPLIIDEQPIRSRGQRFSAHELKIIGLLHQKGYLQNIDRPGSITRTEYATAFDRYLHDRSNQTKINVDIHANASPRQETEARWKKQVLTWGIQRYPTEFENYQLLVDSALRKAMHLWSSVAPLDFRKIPTWTEPSVPDLIFFFGIHGLDASCGKLFPLNELAHNVDIDHEHIGIHFNGRVNWRDDSSADLMPSEADIATVTAHQIGHALGLSDSNDNRSIMHPTYHNSAKMMNALGLSDVQAIQKLYGRPID